MQSWFTCAAKMKKEVKKAYKKAYIDTEHQKLTGMLVSEPVIIAEEAAENTMNRLIAEFDETLELGIQLMMRAHRRIRDAQINGGERWYFLTIRPPHDTKFDKFKADIEQYVERWAYKWDECIYVYEQKGEDMTSLGHGFHVHMRICTTTLNYYPSHILRDCIRMFSYIAPNCIKLEKIVSLQRTIEYMNGDKNDDTKKAACLMDKEWRNANGLPSEVKYKTRLAIQEIA